MNSDEYFMNKALCLAEKAFKLNEIPVGAVIVENNKVIAEGFNQKDNSKLVTKHAELIAIENASKLKGDWRLNDTTLYVTLEPCPMCASAIQQSRISCVVYGCDSKIKDNKEIIEKILKNKNYNHQVELKKGVLKTECSNILKKFFTLKR